MIFTDNAFRGKCSLKSQKNFQNLAFKLNFDLIIGNHEGIFLL